MQRQALTVEAGLESDAALNDVGHVDFVHVPRLGSERTSSQWLVEVGHFNLILSCIHRSTSRQMYSSLPPPVTSTLFITMTTCIEETVKQWPNVRSSFCLSVPSFFAHRRRQYSQVCITALLRTAYVSFLILSDGRYTCYKSCF